jgi:hypothetical protein
MEVSELLFVEYTCMREETRFGIWSNNNYFAFISSGKKMWRSIYHSYEVSEGDIIFVKKGTHLTHQFFPSPPCVSTRTTILELFDRYLEPVPSNAKSGNTILKDTLLCKYQK